MGLSGFSTTSPLFTVRASTSEPPQESKVTVNFATFFRVREDDFPPPPQPGLLNKTTSNNRYITT